MSLCCLTPKPVSSFLTLKPSGTASNQWHHHSKEESKAIMSLCSLDRGSLTVYNKVVMKSIKTLWIPPLSRVRQVMRSSRRHAYQKTHIFTQSHAEWSQIMTTLVRLNSNFLFLPTIWRSCSASIQRCCEASVTAADVFLDLSLFPVSPATPPPLTPPGAIRRPRRSILIKSGTQRGRLLVWAANLRGGRGHFC